MARVCQLTGKKTIVGNNVSHANNKTKRKFFPNLKTKTFYWAEQDTYITLKVSAAAIRNINKKGLQACLREAAEKGYIG